MVSLAQAWREEGIEQGLEQGKLEAKRELARELLSANKLPKADISKLTGFSLKELKNL